MTPTTPRPIITCCSHARSQATGLWRGSYQSLKATKALGVMAAVRCYRTAKKGNLVTEVSPIFWRQHLSFFDSATVVPRWKVKGQKAAVWLMAPQIFPPYHSSTKGWLNYCQNCCLLAHPTELSHVLWVESTLSSYWPMSRNTWRGKKKNLTHQIFCIGPMKCPNRQSLIMYHYKGVKPLVLRSRQLMINERLSVTSLWSHISVKVAAKFM